MHAHIGGLANALLTHAVDEAVEIAHGAVFANMGQCCCAGTRTFVQEGIYKDFVAKAKQMAKARVVGDPFDEKTVQGPQVSGARAQNATLFLPNSLRCKCEGRSTQAKRCSPASFSRTWGCMWGCFQCYCNCELNILLQR